MCGMRNDGLCRVIGTDQIGGCECFLLEKRLAFGGRLEYTVQHVVVINAVYPPEPVVSAQIGRDLAAHLAENGTRVTVVCPFPSRPMGAPYSQFPDRRQVSKVREAGVEVVRVPSFACPGSRLVGRLREGVSFGRHACRYIDEQLADVDVVYANVWPLSCQALIARYCTRREIPLVFHIQDIYPESLRGKLPGSLWGPCAAPLVLLDRWSVRQAARVVVISENMRRTYVDDRGIAPEKVVTVLNWADESRFAHLPSRSDACGHYGIPERPFTFLYLGNIGPVAGVDGLIKAYHAAQLPQAQLVIAGDGSARAGCVDLATRIGASGVHFISDPDVANVPLMQSLAHVCLLPMRAGAGMSSIPSKLMAYLFSERPVLATVDAESDTAGCIREAQCGWVGAPEDAPWLTAKLAEVASMRAESLLELGQRGRSYGLRHFSKAEGVRKLGGVVMDAARGVCCK